MRIFNPDPRFYMRVRRIHEIDPQLLIEHGIRGVAADVDNTVVKHNEMLPEYRVVAWFKTLRSLKIDYCLYTFNCDREHVFNIAWQIECKHVVILDPLNPFDSFIHRPAREMGIELSQIAIVNDFHSPLFWARKKGCMAFKVEPFETWIERTDSFILPQLRWFERKFIEPRLSFPTKA